MNWPSNTAGQVQKKRAAEAEAEGEELEEVVRTEMKEKPAANEAYRPRQRCSSWR